MLGRTSVLSDIDLVAQPGQVTAIVGPNGSGKTTLLRALTGEISAAGRITLDDLPVGPRHAAALASRRAVLPQATRLAFPFTAIEVVRLGHLAGPHAARTDLPARALERVGLGHMVHRFYQDLSGGEQQRAQLARVLAQVWEPRGTGGGANWLFLDEPVSSLDIGQQLVVMRIARDFAADGGGVICVLHDLNLAAIFADAMVVLRQGCVAAQGAPAQVMTSDLLSAVYDCPLRVSATPPGDAPFILPHAAGVM
ncbi:iron complex transport system ATP-binding protein [Roseovarius sp. MBR-78]|uniref:heme ABC transporter ATP-binding protein n=1 Tax=Roseovarius sp. MBR-78 TaxID=3156460 RepID=UPI00339AE3C6